MHKRDYEHEKAISTNIELHWSNYKRLRNAVNTKMRKEKCNYYSNKLSGDQNSKEMWKTLKNILRKEKRCTTNSSPSNLWATKFNEFFTWIARNLCIVFKDSAFPQILVPGVEKDFTLHAIDTSFVRNELAKQKLSKLLDSTKSLQNSLKMQPPL